MENDPDVGVKWVFFSLASLLSPCVLLHDPHTHTHTLVSGGTFVLPAKKCFLVFMLETHSHVWGCSGSGVRLKVRS